jgi:hypothetical protein
MTTIDADRLARLHASSDGNGVNGARGPADVPPPTDEDSRADVREPDEPVKRPRRARLAKELFGLVRRDARRPIVRTGIAALDRAATLRAGYLVVLAGGTGTGKSSIAISWARHHAIHAGPALIAEIEMSGSETGGRLISQAAGISWADALSGSLGDGAEQHLDLPRLRVLTADGCDDEVCPPDCPGHAKPTVGDLDDEIGCLAEEYPGETPLVVVDYLQLLALTGAGREMRERVAVAIEDLRALAQRRGVVIIVIVQVSRPAQAQLRAGELLGADAIGVGAESSQIERAAHVLLALGGRVDREDGTCSLDLSIAKVRAQRSDAVITLDADLRCGLIRSGSDARMASEVRAERQAERGEARTLTAGIAVAGLLEQASEPMSRGAIRERLGLRRQDVQAAIRSLLSDGRVVEVRGRKAGGFWPLWTASRAKEAGSDVVPDLAKGEDR